MFNCNKFVTSWW